MATGSARSNPAPKAARATKATKAAPAAKRTKASKATKATGAAKSAPAPRAAKTAKATKTAEATKATKATKGTTATNATKATKAGKAAKATRVAKPVATAGAEDAPFPADWLEQQRELLEKERATYLHQAEVLQKEADDLVADFEPGDVQFDEESGEGDTLSTERERDLALSAQARAAVEEIDHALTKFAAGTYGICEASGLPIPIERLEAIPWARQRVEYKTGGFGPR